LGGALRSFWRVHGHITEGRSFLERALAASKGAAAFVRAKALIAAANLAFIQSDYDSMEILCKESLALYQELEDLPGIAHSVYLLANVAWTRGDTATARSLLTEAQSLARAIDDEEYVAWSLFVQGLLESSQGNYPRARTLFEESLKIHRQLQNKRGIAHSLSQLAQVLFVSQSDQERVPSLLEECLALSEEIGFKEGVAASSWLSGQVALRQGDLVKARSLAEKGVALYREMGHRHGMAESLPALGKVLAAQGDYPTARTLYEESLAISGELGEKWVVAQCLVGLGEVVAAQRQLAWAAQLWGVAEALRDAIDVPLPPVERTSYDRSVAATRAHLGEGAFATAWAQGRSMTPEQVLVAQGRKPGPPPKTIIPPPTYPDGLSAREVEVLCLVAAGLTDVQIAEKLILSPRTVHAHTSSIYSKLAITSRSAATRYAIEHHLA